MNRPAPTSESPEIIGFGALNVDCIASASRLSQHLAEHITESTARFEWNREGPVDQQTVLAAIQNLSTASLSYSLGGSAWLTIFALAQMRVGLRTGYVGVVGQIEAPGLSFLGQMADLGVDHRWVGRYPNQPCGLCLSYIDDTDRVMLTHPGANFQMAEYIRSNFAEIADYLASARFVHVTSFLDAETPDQVLRVLLRAKEINPALRISFDPGFDWAEHPSPAVAGILRLSDLLFVNYREFKALGLYTYGEPDTAVAGKTLDRCAPGCSVFVTKRYDVVEIFRAGDQGMTAHRFQLQRPFRETDLEDATGAGDVFAAAVLAALSSDRLQVELGAFVGLSLARHKMRFSGADGYQELPDLSKGFLQQTETRSGPDARRGAVFVVHNENRQFAALRNFLERDCGLVTYELSTVEVRENNLAVLMDRYLDHCGFAVCLLGADAPPGGHAPADQNLVHQAGIFQGRYGFGKVAILAEDGCDTFSNIAGLIRLDFPRGQVDATFYDLERMLEREGLVHRRRGPHV
ncbi:MAG TPA: PfkB family carbohydrate kinase [Pseudonocardiaceae bacterium]|nr:PfkB family carbohydrate kinase [Pseudonocardiaceae bacterium]